MVKHNSDVVSVRRSELHYLGRFLDVHVLFLSFTYCIISPNRRLGLHDLNFGKQSKGQCFIYMITRATSWVRSVYTNRFVAKINYQGFH